MTEKKLVTMVKDFEEFRENIEEDPRALYAQFMELQTSGETLFIIHMKACVITFEVTDP